MNLNSYESISKYLTKGKNPTDRPAPKGNGSSNNTRIVRIGRSSVGVKLHKTIIIEYFENGRIRLNTDGWKTITTRDRMNFYSNNYSIWQHQFIWYIEYQSNTYLYEDNMTLFPSGKVEVNNRQIEPHSKNDDKRINTLKKKVDKYCNQFIEKLFNHEIPKPSAGDCWYCCLVDKRTGKPIDDKGNHILSHIEESYYVPSLLVNAINLAEEKGTYGLAPMDKHNLAYCFKQDGWEDVRFMGADITKQRLKMLLKRYVRMQIGLGVT